MSSRSSDSPGWTLFFSLCMSGSLLWRERFSFYKTEQTWNVFANTSKAHESHLKEGFCEQRSKDDSQHQDFCFLSCQKLFCKSRCPLCSNASFLKSLKMHQESSLQGVKAVWSMFGNFKSLPGIKRGRIFLNAELRVLLFLITASKKRILSLLNIEVVLSRRGFQLNFKDF